jgi:hypothetical protein
MWEQEGGGQNTTRRGFVPRALFRQGMDSCRTVLHPGAELCHTTRGGAVPRAISRQGTELCRTLSHPGGRPVPRDVRQRAG